MDFQTMRIYGSIAIILGCFIFLYPKLLHPMVMSIFGYNSSPNEKKADDFVPPALRDKHPEMAHGHHGDLPDHIRKMRQGPHPGMRGAAAEQSKQTKGSGRGMMGVILPMYAVGIVVYLVYTLFKVFGKNDKGGNRRSPVREPRLTDYDSGQQGDEQEETDMRKLQERLAETEAQMTKILAAMQAVQTKVDVAGDEVEKAEGQTEEQTSEEQTGEKAGEKAGEKKEPSNSSDRSSESESYEIVNKSDRESSGDDSPKKVETLTSETAEEAKNEEDEKKVDEEEEEEVREEILKDKEESSGDEAKTVRKRITKKEETES